MKPEQLTKAGTVKQAAQALKQAKSIIVVTGAGLSAGSGIRTFRDKGGYWDQKEGSQELDPMEVLTKRFYDEKPDEVWDWHKKFLAIADKAKPNKGHLALQRLIDWLLAQGKTVTHLTQNIDGLHLIARDQTASNLKKSMRDIY